MKKTFEVINRLEKNGIIKGYAVGGATALLFYTEPALTFDLDIFIFLPGETKTMDILDLSPLYRWLESEGYTPDKEHIMIEGIPVQFIPAYNSLVQEAVNNSLTHEYEGVPIKVLTIEYLLAIMFDTNRPKDRERIRKLLDEVHFNRETLELILRRHSLQNKWEKLSKNE